MLLLWGRRWGLRLRRTGTWVRWLRLRRRRRGPGEEARTRLPSVVLLAAVHPTLKLHSHNLRHNIKHRSICPFILLITVESLFLNYVCDLRALRVCWMFCKMFDTIRFLLGYPGFVSQKCSQSFFYNLVIFCLRLFRSNSNSGGGKPQIWIGE